MSAAKSGKHIYVTGTGNTLESVATDINDALFCSWDAPSKTLTVFGTAADIRYFRIRNGGVLDIIDGETLQFSNATHDDTRFYLDTGGALNMSGDSVLSGSLNNNRPYYWYLYGRLTVIGDATKKPLITNFRRMYCYETNSTNTYSNDRIHCEDMKIGSGCNNGDYAFFFSTMGKVRQHTFRNITVDQTLGNDTHTYPFYWATGVKGHERTILEGIDCVKAYRTFTCSGVPIKTKDCHHRQGMTSYPTYNAYGLAQDHRDFLENFDNAEKKPYGQVFAMHENDTYHTNTSSNGALVTNGGVALYKDCDFLRTSGNAIMTTYGGRSMVWTGNTFADTSYWYSVSQAGELCMVFGCAVNVQDSSGNNIEGAIVRFEQAEGKESFHFTTKANGNLHAIHDLEVALLTWTSRYGNSANNYETWASPTLLHKVTVSKEGYDTVEVEVEMTQDRDIIVQLPAKSVGGGSLSFSQSDKIKLN